MSERKSKMRNKHDPYEGVTGKDRKRLDAFLAWRDATPTAQRVVEERREEHQQETLRAFRKRGFKGGRRGAA